MQTCKEVLASYADGKYDQKLKQKKGANTAGLFDTIDTNALQEGQELKGPDGEADSQLNNTFDDEDAEDGMDDFLKMGGLDVEEMAAPDKQVKGLEDTMKSKGLNQEEGKEEEEKGPSKDTEPEETMKGFLLKSSVKIGGGADEGLKGLFGPNMI